MFRYALLFVILLVTVLPVSPQDLADELDTILTLYGSGLTRIENGLTTLETGLEKVETGLVKLEEGQTILEKQVTDLEKSLRDSERRTRFLSYGVLGFAVLFLVETIAFSVILNSPIYVNK